MEELSFNERLNFFKCNPNVMSQKVFSYNSLDSDEKMIMSPFKERFKFFNTKFSSSSNPTQKAYRSSSFDMLCEESDQKNERQPFNENLKFFKMKSDLKPQKLSFSRYHTLPNSTKNLNSIEISQPFDASAMKPNLSTEDEIHDLYALTRKSKDPKFNSLERRKSQLYESPKTLLRNDSLLCNDIIFDSIAETKKNFDSPVSKPLTFTNYYTPITKDQSVLNITSSLELNRKAKLKNECVIGNNESFEVIECHSKFNQPLDIPFTHKDEFGKIKIHPMLTTEKKNFNSFPRLDSFENESQHPKREDLRIPNANCFILRNFFSKNECEFFIKSSEELGFAQLSNKFPSNYRINDRILFLDEYIADWIWNRLEPCLTRSDTLRIRPIGFGNEGKWLPHRLNECIKVMRYSPGGHFTPHFDGPWVPREDESSIYTLLVYLNDDYIGGHTVFLNENNPTEELSTVKPEIGTALIFNHDCLHKGEPVIQGMKYLLRTEIMFKRVDTECLPNHKAYQDESYRKCLTLYCKSWEHEQADDVKNFTDTYIEAIKSQIENQRSVGLDYKELIQLPIPVDVYLTIFGFLELKDILSCMLTCKQWYDIARCGSLWLKLYEKTWPYGFKVDKSMCDPDLQDWYSNYKSHFACLKFKSFAVLDFGSYSVKLAKVRTFSKKIVHSSIQSYIANIEGLQDLHMRRFTYQRYFCGKQAIESYPNECIKPIKQGTIIPATMWSLMEIFYGLYIDCKMRPKETPLLCVINERYWNDCDKERMSKMLVKHFEHPYVMYVEQSIAVCLSSGVRSALVVKYGAETLSVCYICECKLLEEVAIDPTLSTQEISSILKEFILNQVKGLTCMNNLNMYLVGGGLTETIINEFKNIFHEGETFKRISINFNSDYLSSIMSGIAYVNSLAFYLKNMKCHPITNVSNYDFRSQEEHWYHYLKDCGYWGEYFLRPYEIPHSCEFGNSYLSSDDNYTPPVKDSSKISSENDF